MSNETVIVRSIREEYAEKKENKENKVEQLMNMDRKVRIPAEAFAYGFGSVGSLVLGTGMCLAMKVIGTALSFAMPLGVAIGCVGIAMVSVNYPLYKFFLKKRKKQYAEKILALSDEILKA